ncbi:hypothetical protein G5S42_05330 [Paraburkholderia sp. JPY169]|uniref:Uncharacterized protein n=1 Tax=Paraburkholderia youngii TaxID=2782701 RepID=A0A7Y6JUU9_9BURK|nr:hypothetical protein [Paraburkholderia youngii]
MSCVDVRQADGVARAAAYPDSRAEWWLRAAITLSSLIGCRALANLLAAIPDSNDDFGVF